MEKREISMCHDLTVRLKTDNQKSPNCEALITAL